MSFQPKRLDVTCLTQVIKQVLQKQKPDMNYLEDLLSRLPPDTNQLAVGSLIHDSWHEDYQFLNFISMYFDKSLYT